MPIAFDGYEPNDFSDIGDDGDQSGSHVGHLRHKDNRSDTVIAPDRGRHYDIIIEALAEFDDWMLDDDYNPMPVLVKIMKRMRERLDMSDAPHPLHPAQSSPVQDTWLVGGPDLKAMSGSVESDRVIQLHFRRPVVDKDREWLLEAINAKIAADASPEESSWQPIDTAQSAPKWAPKSLAAMLVRT